MRVVAEVCVQVAKPSKGGPVREALIVAYPRLAAMLEAMFERLVQVGGAPGHMLACMVACMPVCLL